MLFWIILIITALGIAWFIKTDCESMVASLTAGLGTLGFVVSIFVMIFNFSNVKGYTMRAFVRYDTLVYQYENDLYDNDNDLGKRELITDIQSWNEDLAWYKEAQDNFWIGIYIPNVYDSFEFISLEK